MGGARRGGPPLVSLLLTAAVTLVAVDSYGPAGPAFARVRGAARAALAPAEDVAAAAFDPVAGLVRSAGRGGDLARENARLRAELTRARSQAARTDALVRENLRLGELLGLSTAGVAGAAGAPLVAARVVSVPGGRPTSTLVVDRGSDAGVAVDMPVLAGGALVGRVVWASPGRAAVLPVSDPGFVVGIRLAGTGEIGVASGWGRTRPLGVEMLDPAAAVTPGDLALTSGLEHGRFPPGLPVGRVRASRSGAVRLDAIAAVSRLEFVEIVRWQAP